MELSILEKAYLVLKYFASSFLGIELFLVALLLFLFLFLNIKYDDNKVKIVTPIFLVMILLFISGGFHLYVKESIDAFIKYIIRYYYFPNMAIYYITVLVVTILFIYTILSNLSKIKKIINYISFSLIYLNFIGLASFLIEEGIELTLDSTVYQYDLVAAFVNVSNLILLLWILITFFYYLYNYFKKKFDHLNT